MKLYINTKTNQYPADYVPSRVLTAEVEASIHAKNKDLPEFAYDILLASKVLEEVIPTDKPVVAYDKDLVEGQPVKTDRVWHQVWNTVDVEPSIAAARLSTAESAARSKRSDLLTASDWTQVADSPADSAVWAEYRDKLRDITDQTGFPWTIDWPLKPGETAVEPVTLSATADKKTNRVYVTRLVPQPKIVRKTTSSSEPAVL